LTGMKSTLAFWAFLICIAVWQSAYVPVTTPEEPPLPVAVAPVGDAPGRVAPPPRPPRGKFDLSGYTQNTEFFLGTPRGDAEFGTDDPGRSGPYDSEGKLIFPLDPRGMH